MNSYLSIQKFTAYYSYACRRHRAGTEQVATTCRAPAANRLQRRQQNHLSRPCSIFRLAVVGVAFPGMFVNKEGVTLRRIIKNDYFIKILQDFSDSLLAVNQNATANSDSISLTKVTASRPVGAIYL